MNYQGIILALILSVSGWAYGAGGEFYSETLYTSRYGFLTDTHLRLTALRHEDFHVYGLLYMQRQDHSSTQETLYTKNRLMYGAGFRYRLIYNLSLAGELISEDRSRFGLYVGDIFQYQWSELQLFSEFYAESFVLPEYSQDPISSGWFKQGWRKKLSHVTFDIYAELNLRQSPSPDLGRDIRHVRLGTRFTYFFTDRIYMQALGYQVVNETPSEPEGLLVLGGAF